MRGTSSAHSKCSRTQWSRFHLHEQSLNPAGQSCTHTSVPYVLQYYALGVPAAGALDVYIAIDAAPERLGYLAANTANRDADWLTDRVVEAVLLESLIQWQRKSGLVCS